MSWAGALVRLLMLGTCLVPFTSPRQAAAVLALPNPAPDPPPAGPQGLVGSQQHPEEDVLQEGGRGGKQRVGVKQVGGSCAARPAAPTHDPAPTRLVLPAFPARPPVGAPHPGPAPRPTDPFRNGLGAPYRC
jgi:hypothetical protein